MAVNQTAMLSAIRPAQSPCSRRAYSWGKGLPWCSRGTVKHHSFCVTCKETPNRVNLSLARCTKWRQRQTHGELQERWSFLVWAFPDTRWDVANVQCQLILIKGAQQSDAKYLLSAQRIKLHCFQHTVFTQKSGRMSSWFWSAYRISENDESATFISREGSPPMPRNWFPPCGPPWPPQQLWTQCLRQNNPNFACIILYDLIISYLINY